MSIVRAIQNAYDTARKRKWDTIHWAIDLHGVCLKSTYKERAHEFYSEDAIKALKMISALPESKIIIWTSTHEAQYPVIRALFECHGIRINYINENPEVQTNGLSSFDSKFYFSVLLDDKAGFDQIEDWERIITWLRVNHEPLTAAAV